MMYHSPTNSVDKDKEKEQYRWKELQEHTPLVHGLQQNANKLEGKLDHLETDSGGVTSLPVSPMIDGLSPHYAPTSASKLHIKMKDLEDVSDGDDELSFFSSNCYLRNSPDIGSGMGHMTTQRNEDNRDMSSIEIEGARDDNECKAKKRESVKNMILSLMTENRLLKKRLHDVEKKTDNRFNEIDAMIASAGSQRKESQGQNLEDEEKRQCDNKIPLSQNNTFWSSMTKSLSRNWNLTDSLQEDTFSLMMISKPNSSSWILGCITIVLQFLLAIMIAQDQIAPQSSQSTIFNIPFTVDLSVRVGQFLSIIFCVLSQSDIIVSIQTLCLLWRNTRWETVIIFERDGYENPDWRWQVLFPNVARLFQGKFVVFISCVLIIQSDNIINLLKDFTALMVISELDNLIFQLAVAGYLGRELQLECLKVREIELDLNSEWLQSAPPRLLRQTMLFFVVTSMFGGWAVVLVQQERGIVFGNMFPKCKVEYKDAKKHFGDGECFGGDFNNIDCAFEGGDCINFNLAFPMCRKERLNNVQKYVGDGNCDADDKGLFYNFAECDFDGGDCCGYDIQTNNLFGNNQCNGGQMSSSRCGYDNGDCNAFAIMFPGCPIDDLALLPGSNGIVLGDGVCDGGRYTKEDCGFEAGDCDVGQVGQDLNFKGASSGSSLHFSTEMSNDGSKVMAGLYFSTIEGNFDSLSAGIVEFRSYNSKNMRWEPFGQILSGDLPEEHFGWRMSMSQDGTRVVIGAPYNSISYSGQAKVYDFNSKVDKWIQLGQTIKGKKEDILGFSVDITADGSRLAVAAPCKNSKCLKGGYIRVFDLGLTKQWEQVGNDISGVIGREHVGVDYVLLSPLDGSRIFFSAGSTPELRVLRMYQFNEIAKEWTKCSQDIQNPYANRPTIALDGSRIAISSYSIKSDTPGKVQIFDLDQRKSIVKWKQIGRDLFEEREESRNGFGFGNSISFSSDGNLLAIASANEACIDGSSEMCATGSVQLYSHEPTNPADHLFAKLSIKLIDEYRNVVQESERSIDSSIFANDVALSGDGSKFSVSGYHLNSKSGFINVYTIDQLFHPKSIFSPFREVDFSVMGPEKLYDFELLNNTKIEENAPNGVTKALRIDSNGKSVKLPGVDISPSAMPDCTLVIGIYLESIVQDSYGWVVSNEDGGWDRSIIMHDNRLEGIAMGLGYENVLWEKEKIPQVGEWLHVVAVFRENRDSYLYIDGVRSLKSNKGQNGPGLPDLYIGQPKGYINHYSDCWIKEVKVFDRALTDEEVKILHKTYTNSLS